MPDVQKYLNKRPKFEVSVFKRAWDDKKLKWSHDEECNDIHEVHQYIEKMLVKYAQRTVGSPEKWRIAIYELSENEYVALKVITLDSFTPTTTSK